MVERLLMRTSYLLAYGLRCWAGRANDVWRLTYAKDVVKEIMSQKTMIQ